MFIYSSPSSHFSVTKSEEDSKRDSSSAASAPEPDQDTQEPQPIPSLATTALHEYDVYNVEDTPVKDGQPEQ